MVVAALKIRCVTLYSLNHLVGLKAGCQPAQAALKALPQGQHPVAAAVEVKHHARQVPAEVLLDGDDSVHVGVPGHDDVELAERG